MTPTKEPTTTRHAESPAADRKTPTSTAPGSFLTSCPNLDLGNCTAGEERILTLVIVDGKTQAQAARALKCSRANISQTLTRALRKMRAANPTPPHAPATVTHTTPPEPRQQASPLPPELLARYIELVELEALICEAPDGIERDEASGDSHRVVDLGNPLGGRRGGHRRHREKGHYDQFELDAIRVMRRTEPDLPESDYQPWWNYSSDGKRIAPAKAVNKGADYEKTARDPKEHDAE